MVQELSCGSWPDFSSVSGGTSKSGRTIRHVTSFGETEVCWNCIPVIISWILWRCFVYLFLCPLLWLHKWLKIWQNSHKEEEVENSELKKHKKKKKKKEKKKKGKQKVVCCWWIWFIRFVYLFIFFLVMWSDSSTSIFLVSFFVADSGGPWTCYSERAKKETQIVIW